MNNTNFSNNISNENIMLVDILKKMYTDNIRQINNMTNSINNIRNTNSQIRNMLMQVLLYQNTSTNSIRNQRQTNTTRENLNRNQRQTNTTRENSIRNQRQTNTTRENLNRVILNNIPYVIDSFQQFTIPLTQQTNNTNTTQLSGQIQSFFQPVEVYPTQSQIENATRNVQYCDIVNPVNRSCPISLDTFTDSDMVSVIRFCGHIFKPDQLITWFRSNCRCPICRYDIRSYNANSSSIFSNSFDVDISNNLTNVNNSEERTQTNNSLSDSLTSYLDLILDTTNIDFSETTDANALFYLLSTLQRR